MIAQILVADDSAEIAAMISEHLAFKNHRVLLAKDGFELARKAAEHIPHLIIADIMMPGAYGSTAYHVLQRDPKTRSIPILFISAYPYGKIKEVLPRDPKTRFLSKPLAFDKMDQLIGELLPLGGYIP